MPFEEELDEVVLDELALVGALLVVDRVPGALRVLDVPEPPLGAAAPPLAAPLQAVATLNRDD